MPYEACKNYSSEITKKNIHKLRHQNEKKILKLNFDQLQSGYRMDLKPTLTAGAELTSLEKDAAGSVDFG